MLNLHNLRITAHAVDKMGERGVNVEDLADTLLRPAIVEPHAGQRRFVGRSGLVLVIDGTDDRPVLVTILLRSGETWDDDEVHRHFTGE